MATLVKYPLPTAEQFLDTDLGEQKAELDNGVIRMMAGGTARHAQVSGNIFAAAPGWSDVRHDGPFNVPLPSLDLTIDHEEIFARD